MAPSKPDHPVHIPVYLGRGRRLLVPTVLYVPAGRKQRSCERESVWFWLGQRTGTDFRPNGSCKLQFRGTPCIPVPMHQPSPSSPHLVYPDPSSFMQQSSFSSQASFQLLETGQLWRPQTNPGRQSRSLSQSPSPSPHWKVGVQQLDSPWHLGAWNAKPEGEAHVGYESSVRSTLKLASTVLTPSSPLQFPLHLLHPGGATSVQRGHRHGQREQEELDQLRHDDKSLFVSKGLHP